MKNEVQSMFDKLAARHQYHAEALKTASKTLFVVVPKGSDEVLGEHIITSAFVETVNDGKRTGYEVHFSEDPYTYILPEAMKVAKKMRKATGRKFTWISAHEWHKIVLECLKPYAKNQEAAA